MVLHCSLNPPEVTFMIYFSVFKQIWHFLYSHWEFEVSYQGNINLKLELQWRTFNWNLKVLLIKEAVFCIVHCLLLPLYLIEQFLRFQGAQFSNVSAWGCLM